MYKYKLTLTDGTTLHIRGKNVLNALVSFKTLGHNIDKIERIIKIDLRQTK